MDGAADTVSHQKLLDSGRLDVYKRQHGDAMKTPSELGFRIPAHVENAIMKALAVQTEDRFPNMEAFIGALNGRVSVQDQVAASISQRTQATAYGQGGYGQPSYSAGGTAAGKPSVFSRLLSYMKANQMCIRDSHYCQKPTALQRPW